MTIRKMLGRSNFIGLSVALATATVAASTPVRAETADFSKKTIEFIVPFGVGGGSDTWARFNAPFLGKYLPGNPTVVVKNLPGGGSITGANQFAARAKADGLSLLGTSASTQFPYLLGDPRVRFEYKDWQVVLAAPTGGVTYINTNLGVKSLADLGQLKGQRLVYGSQGATTLDLVPLLAFRLLGLDVHHVFGMKSRGEGRLAFERGEANIDFQTTSAYLKSSLGMVQEGKAIPLFTMGMLDDAGNLVRDANFPDLPHVGEAIEIVTGKPPAGIEWEAFRALLIAGFPAQKLMVLPKATPQPIVEAYRAAVRQMRLDPDYQASKDDALGGYEQVTDGVAEALFAAGTTIAPEARDWVRAVLEKDYNTRF
ncbi:hypothetical protein [Thauera sp.]|uniref:Bug family tripartite tricarboxylate transporter substrate binding protein n=1 Tax=Thauera sp. TaxID=1905334 RepID=UPI002C57A9F5|nr:hypothetical protein [Thauera sp.]HRP22560.1 tripartite tricarboxylate transporter substrate-binding protein [Thauera sp.]